MVAAILLTVSTAEAAIINVPGDEPTIQAGIDAAMNGDEVVVAQGEYFETIDFLGKAITVRSTNPNDPKIVADTIINGGGIFPNTVVTCGSNEGPDTVLSGFVITGGNNILGGGMYNDGSSPTVANCTFSGNTATVGGGMLNQSNNPTITNCTFSGNTAVDGGGMYNILSSPTVSNCTFSGNMATGADGGGGGMYNFDQSPTVTNCTFEGNEATNGTGGGIYNKAGSSPTVADCTFCGNSPGHVAPDLSSLSGLLHMTTFCPIPVCPGDINGDGNVGINDFLDLLAAWGPCP